MIYLANRNRICPFIIRRSIVGIIVWCVLSISALAKGQTNSLPNQANSKRAKEYYNYSYRLFNYIQAKGKFNDFYELLKISKKGLSYTKASDFKNLSGLQFLTGMSYKILLVNDSAFFYLKNSIMNAQRGNELDIEISGIQQINYLYRYLGQIKETQRYVERLKALKAQVKDVYLKDKIVSALSDEFLHLGAYTQAVELLLGSLTTKEYLYKQKKDYKSRINLALALSELGSLYLQLNQNQNALNYLKKGEPYFVDYTGGRVRLYKKLQQAYLNLSKIDSAMIYYQKIYGEMQVGIYESADDLSGANRQLAEYYLAQHNMPMAIKYAEIAYEKGMISGSKEAIMMAINMMGKLNYQQKKYHEAIRYFEKALPNSTNFSNDVFASINLRLAQSYEQIGNHKKANLFYSRYNLLRDTIYIEKTREDINVIEFKYKNAQKEQRIDFLNVQSKAQAKELVRQKQYKAILIISMFLVLIIAALVFYNYKQKQKVNLLLDKKNHELDKVNSQLSIANQTKTKLFSIISHDLRSPVSQLFTFLKLQQLNSPQISNEEKSTHQKKLMQSASAMLSMMEDLLLWSKSQMENFELDIEEVSALHLFEESITLIQDQADAKEISIKIGDLKAQNLQGDRNLLLIVLRNLLQNAINNSYNHTSIILTAGLNERQKRYISIINKGEIIPQEKIEQLLSNQYVKSKSSGYGLVIVKELLQKLDGALQIKSTADATIITIAFS